MGRLGSNNKDDDNNNNNNSLIFLQPGVGGTLVIQGSKYLHQDWDYFKDPRQYFNFSYPPSDTHFKSLQPAVTDLGLFTPLTVLKHLHCRGLNLLAK